MDIILFDERTENLFPFSLTRPIAGIRWGILTIEEKWKKHACNVSFLTKEYLSKKFPCNYTDENLYVNSRLIPTQDLLNAIGKLEMDCALTGKDGELLALKSSKRLSFWELSAANAKKLEIDYLFLDQVWELFTKNEEAILLDYELLTKDRKSQKLSTTNTLLGDQIFLEEGAKVEATILNSSTGPIYIGRNAEIMEGSTIRGPFALGESAVVKMAAKIYGATTIGPFSKVGGEINNSIIFGYSNKGHDGFLGNSILGEWCNLGADTNVSNLKNDYGNVKIWDFKKASLKDTGQQFCGLMMGDHSKSGINTMFNTGTVIGVNCNIFGSDFPEKFVPSFSWGGKGNWSVYRLDKAFDVAQRVMKRRDIVLSDEDKAILEHIFNEAESQKS